MELNIGANIRRLRLSRGLTQERLAELLCVSSAAVCKWEAKNTYPDITLLIPLAGIFGVSVDEIIGYDEAKANAEIESLLSKHHSLYVDGRFDEARELITEARKKYPHDYRIMCSYMWDIAGGRAGNYREDLLAHRDELFGICGCILEGCTKDSIRAEAINMKAKLLHADGDTNGALDALSQFPRVQAMMYKEDLFGKDTFEFRCWNMKNCCALIDLMAARLARVIRFDPSLSVAEKTARLERVAEIFSETSQNDDLSFLCIAEHKVYAILAGMLTADSTEIENVIRIREKQFASASEVMKLAQTDDAMRELLFETYNTDDIVGWEVNRLLNSPHPQFAKLRENDEYVNMLRKYER